MTSQDETSHAILGPESARWREVCIYTDSAIRYPSSAPFSPSKAYPEYRYSEEALSSEENRVYDAVRNCLFAMGLDRSFFGTPRWNPLGEFIKPGSRVLIKPNMVRHYRPNEDAGGAIVTHGSIVRAMMDYVVIALHDRGVVVLGDAPIQRTVFDRVLQENGLADVVEFHRKASPSLAFETVDFRTTVAVRNRLGHVSKSILQSGDETGYKRVLLDGSSMVEEIVGRKMAVSMYPRQKMARYHQPGRHEYLIPQRVLDADVIINLPKPKTHRYAGLTGATKNFIGINGTKASLPHFRRGSPSEGGDEYPHPNVYKKMAGILTDWINWLVDRKMYPLSIPLRTVEDLFVKAGRKANPVFEGFWYGNDTIWRTILDVYRVVLSADTKGLVHPTPQRTIFSLADGIVAGEGNGPLNPTPRQSGFLVAGFNCWAVDLALTCLMGLDAQRLPVLAKCPIELGRLDMDTVNVQSNEALWNGNNLTHVHCDKPFAPPKGWEGVIGRSVDATEISGSRTQ